MKLLILATLTSTLFADGTGVILSRRIRRDFELTADPKSSAWRGVPGVIAENNTRGEPVPGHRTEIRSRWTDRNVYFLFVCPYETLNLKPDPKPNEETNRLWNWDVAEIFVGWDFKNIKRYKEFQVSPQSEWVDLDIDREKPQPEGGWKWNSGFQVKGRIDEKNRIWYGEMRIPIGTITEHSPKRGTELRINFFRLQGTGTNKRGVAWQPTHTNSHHVPEAFGRLRFD